MKLPLPKRAVLIFLLLLVIVPAGMAIEWGGHSGMVLSDWEIHWEQSEGPSAQSAVIPADGWVKVTGQFRPVTPEGTTAAWLRLSIPPHEHNSVLLIDKVYGDTLQAYMNHELLFDSREMESYNGSKVLIPLSGDPAGGQLYLWCSGVGKGFGIEGEIRVGSYDKLLTLYVKEDMVDLVIGAALLFLAAALAVCLFFLKLEFFSGGFSLMLVILSFGVMLITYSPFLPLMIGGPERIIDTCFDIALFTLLPAFSYYFEQIFGMKKSPLSRFRKFQMAYSIGCASLLVLNYLLAFRLDAFYRIMTVEVLGVLMIIQFLFLMALAVQNACQGNRDALIFSIGFSIFSVLSLFELALYYTSAGRYPFYWWKWGMVVFVVSLIVILGRSFARNHEKAVEYAKELEKFNNDLQRSEKMEIISELAASVAHEVRNPLQVTRGFLQILGERSGRKEKEYMQMAMDELDRASVIITDFLTFAKPGEDKVEVFEVNSQLRHVTGILVPLANLQGGTIKLKLQGDLQVMGSSAKFKQAFINLIKNSIESLEQDGLITVTAWKSGDYIIISVEDNGEGMKGSELARLGEPYYSNKTKGTGLGLMVTFRIIEAMNGTINFQSKKGEGTEVIVKLPASVS